MSNEDLTRLDILLADRATGDLENAGHRELAQLLGDTDDPHFELDLAAAALDLALAPEEMAMPADLRLKIEAMAPLIQPEKVPAVRVTDLQSKRLKPGQSGRSALGWVGWLAAAASLAFALFIWREYQPQAPVDIAAQREALVSGAPDAVALAWTATADPAATVAKGDVLWSNQQQKGFMRIQGLEANNPSQVQYQLWIFDEARENPVDGGVFNVPAGQTEVIVPIDAKLLVNTPKLFAITVEKPGGVVVSKQERIVLVADPAKAG